MKKVIIAILAFAVLATGVLFAVAHRPGAGKKGLWGKRGGHHRGGMMLRGLDLTDEQKGKVKEIMDLSRTNVEPVMASMKENHQKMNAATAGGAFDQAQVEALAAEGVQSILLEGGPTIATSFLEAGLIDKLLVFVAPTLSGDGSGMLAGLPRPLGLSRLEARAIGDDVPFKACADRSDLIRLHLRRADSGRRAHAALIRIGCLGSPAQTVP